MESFEQIGIWFLPEKPEDILPGKLSFAPDKKPQLDLIGTWEDGNNIEEELDNIFSQNPSPKNYQIINGWLMGESNKKQERVTLCNCYKKLQLKIGNEIETATFFPQIIIVGYHFSKIEHIKFTDVLVRYELLETWVNSPNIEVTSIGDELVIKQKQQQPQVIGSLGKFSIAIKDQVPHLSTAWQLAGPIRRIHGIEERKSILFTTKSPVQLNEFIDVIGSFQDFLTFCCGQKILPETIKSEVFCYDTKENFPIKIFYQLSSSPITKASQQRLFLDFSDLKSDSENVLKNWGDLSDNLTSIIQLYLRIYYIPLRHVNDTFLSLTQALEAFHRAKHSGKFILKERLEDLLSSIDDSLPETFFNESNLKSDFSEKVKTTRNALTHLSNKNNTKKDKIFQGRELKEANSRLLIILEICILKDLGLEPANIKLVIRGKHLIS